MSFNPITGSAKFGIRVEGLDECLKQINAMRQEIPRTKTDIHRDASTFFVHAAKDKVHVVTGRLGRSIKVDSITDQRAVVSANTKYAALEEGRKGNRRIAPYSLHAFMHPAAIETGAQMPRWIKTRFDALFARHKSA
jgi:hypothetical protein